MIQITLPAFICKIFRAGCLLFLFPKFSLCFSTHLHYFRKTIEQPTLECQICYLSKSKFKKQHNNEPHHPPHFICIDCHEKIVAHFPEYGQILCPICQVPNYTQSLSYYSPCCSCDSMVKSANWESARTQSMASYQHLTDCHHGITICTRCIPNTAKVCPLCHIPCDFSDPWNFSPHYMMSLHNSSTLLHLVRPQPFSNSLTIYISL